MSIRHTPTPWCLRPAPASCVDIVTPATLDRPSAGSIARVRAGSGGIPVEANACRIVACVNACEGIGTDDLEKAAALDPYRRLIKLSFLASALAAEPLESRS